MNIVTISSTRTVLSMDTIEAAIVEYASRRGVPTGDNTNVELNIETSPSGEVVGISAVLVTEVETVLDGTSQPPASPSANDILDSIDTDRDPRLDPNGSSTPPRGGPLNSGLGR